MICVATATTTFVTASTSDISRDWRIDPPLARAGRNSS